MQTTTDQPVFFNLTKPSQALEVMVRGLLKAMKRKTFQIDMGIFGDTDSTTCFGCAASVAAFEAANLCPTIKNFGDITTQAKTIGLTFEQLYAFENAIDIVRRGRSDYLLKYFNQEKHFTDVYNFLIREENAFYLRTDDWFLQLPRVRRLIAFLKTLGI